MKLKSIYLIVLIITIVILTGCSTTQQSSTTGNTAIDIIDDPGKVTVYFFWGDGCPHCSKEKPFLEDMQEKYPEIEIKMFETWYNSDNAKLFSEVAKAYGTTAQGVPTTFIDDKVWVGYADYMGEEMEAKIKSCIDTGCVNPGDKLN